jgi:ubiquinone/menaquinone biosynthesis C-methylase UbiE
MTTWLEREARRLNKARALLRPALSEAGGVWADLGCGEGVFTAVLVELLSPGSDIYAVDKNRWAVEAMARHLSESYPQAAIHPVEADFTQPLSLPVLDGLVMANAIHFVRRKRPILVHLVNLLKPGGRLLIVEYNTSRDTVAVPYPLDEAGFLALAGEVGLRQAQIVTRVPSTYLGQMYTGLGLAPQADG